MERVGESWWPVFGAVYCVVAVKRVRGMRLVGLARALRRAGQTAPAVAVSQRGVEAKTMNCQGTAPAPSGQRDSG
jgi:hypothetical protein